MNWRLFAEYLSHSTNYSLDNLPANSLKSELIDSRSGLLDNIWFVVFCAMISWHIFMDSSIHSLNKLKLDTFTIIDPPSLQRVILLCSFIYDGSINHPIFIHDFQSAPHQKCISRSKCVNVNLRDLRELSLELTWMNIFFTRWDVSREADRRPARTGFSRSLFPIKLRRKSWRNRYWKQIFTLSWAMMLKALFIILPISSNLVNSLPYEQGELKIAIFMAKNNICSDF